MEVRSESSSASTRRRGARERHIQMTQDFEAWHAAASSPRCPDASLDVPGECSVMSPCGQAPLQTPAPVSSSRSGHGDMLSFSGPHVRTRRVRQYGFNSDGQPMTPSLAPEELTAQVLFAEQEIGRLQLALKESERVKVDFRAQAAESREALQVSQERLSTLQQQLLAASKNHGKEMEEAWLEIEEARQEAASSQLALSKQRAACEKLEIHVVQLQNQLKDAHVAICSSSHTPSALQSGTGECLEVQAAAVCATKQQRVLTTDKASHASGFACSAGSPHTMQALPQAAWADRKHRFTRSQQAAMVGLVSQVETAVLHVATACICAVKVWQQQVPMLQELHSALQSRGCLPCSLQSQVSSSDPCAAEPSQHEAVTKLERVLNEAMSMSQQVDTVLRTAKREHQRRLRSATPSNEAAVDLAPPQIAREQNRSCEPDVAMTRWRPVEPLQDCGGVGVVRSSRRAKRVPAPLAQQHVDFPAEVSPYASPQPSGIPRTPAEARAARCLEPSLSPPSLTRRQCSLPAQAEVQLATAEQLAALRAQEQQLANAMCQLVRVGEQISELATETQSWRAQIKAGLQGLSSIIAAVTCTHDEETQTCTDSIGGWGTELGAARPDLSPLNVGRDRTLVGAGIKPGTQPQAADPGKAATLANPILQTSSLSIATSDSHLAISSTQVSQASGGVPQPPSPLTPVAVRPLGLPEPPEGGIATPEPLVPPADAASSTDRCLVASPFVTNFFLRWLSLGSWRVHEELLNVRHRNIGLRLTAAVDVSPGRALLCAAGLYARSVVGGAQDHLPASILVSPGRRACCAYAVTSPPEMVNLVWKLYRIQQLPCDPQSSMAHFAATFASHPLARSVSAKWRMPSNAVGTEARSRPIPTGQLSRHLGSAFRAFWGKACVRRQGSESGASFDLGTSPREQVSSWLRVVW